MCESFDLFLKARNIEINNEDINRYGYHVSLLKIGLKDYQIFELYVEYSKRKNIIKVEKVVTTDFVLPYFSVANFRAYIKFAFFITKHKEFGKILMTYSIDVLIKNSDNFDKILTVSFDYYQRVMSTLYSIELSKNAIFSRNQSAKTIYRHGAYIYYRFMFLCCSVCLSIIFAPLLFWLWYLYNILLRVVYISLAIFKKKRTIITTSCNRLPVYTILIPMFKEKSMVSQVVAGISKLNYPKFLLDVKIITEQNDAETKEAINNIGLPEYISVIEVPESVPQNKPKALNFAFMLSRGEYLTIFDAEDIPHVDQLLSAVDMFMADSSIVALQGRLDYYNYKYNILSMLCALEYKIWFNLMLPGASVIGGFIPLGGTTNHCRIDVLEECGLWDAFNVTEDIELSSRIIEKGYKIGFLDSVTMEESVVTINAWIKQRTRWIKGYIITLITYFYFFNSSRSNIYNRINFNNLCFFVVINSFAIFFILMLCLVRIFLGLEIVLIDYVLFKIGTVICIFLILFYAITSCIMLNVGFWRSVLIGCCFPFYCMLQMFSFMRALFQIYQNRSYLWEKTEHGIVRCE